MKAAFIVYIIVAAVLCCFLPFFCAIDYARNAALESQERKLKEIQGIREINTEKINQENDKKNGIANVNQVFVLNEIQVKINKIFVDFPEVKNRFSDNYFKISNKKLIVQLNIENKNSNKIISYIGWGRERKIYDDSNLFAELKDEFDNEYLNYGSVIDVKNKVSFEKIEPKSNIDDVLIFDVPWTGSKYTILKLPSKNFYINLSSDYKFKINKEIWNK